MVKVSVNRYISSRVEAMRNDVNAETQKLRQKMLDKLNEIFNVAAKIDEGKISHQRIKGKMTTINVDQRKKWLRVAEHIALTIKTTNSNIDEKEIHSQLNKLETLIKEAQTIQRSTPEDFMQRFQSRSPKF